MNANFIIAVRDRKCEDLPMQSRGILSSKSMKINDRSDSNEHAVSVLIICLIDSTSDFLSFTSDKWKYYRFSCSEI